MRIILSLFFSQLLFSFQVPSLSKVTHIKDVRAIFKDGSRVWVGTKGNGFHFYQNNTWSKIEHGNIPNGITSFTKSIDNQLVVAGSNGFVINDGVWSAYTLDDMNLSGKVLFSADLINDKLWFGGAGGAASYDGKTFEIYSDKNALTHAVVHDIIFFKDRYYFATRKGGLNVFDGKNWTYYFPDKNCRALFIDNRGILWVGTSKGALQFDGETWYTHHEGLPMIPAENDSKNNYILFISEGTGILIYDHVNWRLMDMKDGLSSNEIYTIEEVTAGNFWLGHKEGIDMIQLH